MKLENLMERYHSVKLEEGREKNSGVMDIEEKSEEQVQSKWDSFHVSLCSGPIECGGLHKWQYRNSY
jgi:hypothetical protein